MFQVIYILFLIPQIKKQKKEINFRKENKKN
jgi:hypothetical protein